MPKFSRREFIKFGIRGIGALSLGHQFFRISDLAAMELDIAGSSYNYAKVTERVPVPFVACEGRIKNVCQAFVEDGGKIVQIGGHPNHIGTRGRISPQENTLYLQLYNPDRILFPLRRTGQRGSGQWKRVSWDEALNEVSERIRGLLEVSPEEICLNMGKEDISGGAWTRFMHTLGSDSILQSSGDGNKRVAMLHTWGADIEIPDLSNTRYILNFGSNIFETFHPYAQRVVDGRMDNRAKLVTFDPRVSMTAGLSDEWFPILPGTDGLVALSMANVIMDEGLADVDFINEWTNHPADKLAKYLKQYTPEMAERYSGVPAKEIKRIAIEFAKTKPATIFTYRGVSSHSDGVYQERACMLLPIITGNVEIKGGYCLPRRMSWNEVEPIPPLPKKDSLFDRIKKFPLGKPYHLLPFLIKDGRVKVKVLFNYGTNPAYSAPAASFLREVMKDEGLIPFIVVIDPFMSETAELADIILPGALPLERNEPDTSPSLWPWFGIRQSIQRPPGECKEVRMILKDLIHKIDPDGKKGMRRYWEFEDAEEWMRRHFDGIPGIGGYDSLKKEGVWPVYGKLDPATGKILDEDGNPVEAKYGIYKKELTLREMRGSLVHPQTGVIFNSGRPIGIRIKGKNYRGFDTPSRRIEIFVDRFRREGFEPLPTWKPLDIHRELKEDEFFLITFKDRYHTGSATANNKFLAEMSHSNPVWINREVAEKMGIEDGALVRVTSPAGYMVTRAMVTNAIHPKVVGISSGGGHRAYGRVARARPKDEPSMWSQGTDPDIEHNLWWDDNGVHPNDIIHPSTDPIGGGQGWGDTIVRITPAQRGDEYGDVKVNNNIHYDYYNKENRR